MNTNPNTKRILCYGDSYVWGYMPNTNHIRLPADVRWTGQLQNLLGQDYEVIEEGLNSRTMDSEDPRTGKEGRNGSQYLIPCLDSHDPIDLVILMIGTNELKDSYNAGNEAIVRLLEDKFIKVILGRKSQFSDKTPQLVLVIPPRVDISKEYAQARYAQVSDKYISLVATYKALAQKYSLKLIDSGEFLVVGDDGVHLDAENHQKLAQKIFKQITGNS